MHRILALAIGWSLALAACGPATHETTTTGDLITRATTSPSASTDRASPIPTVPPPFTNPIPGVPHSPPIPIVPHSVIPTPTVPPPFTSTTAPPSATTTTLPWVPVEVEVVDGPGYVVWGSEGVFRVEDGETALALDRSDVTWASDDGMRGIVFRTSNDYFSALYQQAAGQTTPRVIGTEARPDYVTLVDGRPTLVMWARDSGCSGDSEDSSILVDLQTDGRQTDWKCWEVGLPYSLHGVIGDRLRVSEADESIGIGDPHHQGLVFKALDFRTLGLPGNPRPVPCHWCDLAARLSPDGRFLALVEFIPKVSDFDWAELEAHAEEEDPYQTWAQLEETSERMVSTSELGTGEPVYIDSWPQSVRITGFDGRYLVVHSGEDDADIAANFHLIDTFTGEELPIDWGVVDPGAEWRGISLLVRRSPDWPTNAPDLMVKAPPMDAVVSERTARFEGTASPGCTVVSSRGEKTTSDAVGSWSMSVALDPGVNWETFTATDRGGRTRSVLTSVLVDPSGFYSLDGSQPDQYPPRWNIGFISLLSTRADVETELGPADFIDEDAGYYGQDVDRWDLAGDATLTIESLPWRPSYVFWASLHVPQGSPVRFGLAGGIAVGGSSLQDLVDAWGEPTYCADIGKSDCDLLYSECTSLVMVNGSSHATRSGDIDQTEPIRQVILGENQDPAAWEACSGQ